MSENKKRIELTNLAEKTENSADADIMIESDNEPLDGRKVEDVLYTNCSDGHTRRKSINGNCYCQMCCNGKWKYFYKVIDGKRVYLKCGEGAWTVKCADKNYILSC